MGKLDLIAVVSNACYVKTEYCWKNENKVGGKESKIICGNCVKKRLSIEGHCSLSEGCYYLN